MFRKLIIASTVLAITASPAFAGNYKGDYKGEAPAPCVTYNPAIAPYIGMSIGGRNTFSSAAPAYSGILGTLSLGYGGIVAPNWYLAGEGFVDGSINVSNVSALKTTWDYGLSVLPGYLITDNLLGYLRLGAIETRFSTQNTWKVGYQVGLGGQTNLWQNWDMRAEYVYTGYSHVNYLTGSPKSSSVNFGLIYKFT